MAVRATLITNGETLVGSYIKYSSLGETHSYLLNYGRGVHKVYIYEINEEKRTTYLVGECLGVSELRRVIVDRLIEQGTNDIPIHKNENGSYVFNDGLEVKSNGDVTVGKNLEIDGKVLTVNGKQWGIMPVLVKNNDNSFTEVGFIFNDVLPTIENGELSISGAWFNSTNDSFRVLPEVTSLELTSPDTKIENGIFYIGESDDGNIGDLFYYIVYDYTLNNKLVEYQPKLFRHTLTITANAKDYILVYDSTSNLRVDCIADLRTIMKISSSHESEMLPVCFSDATSTACLKVTTSVCQIGTTNVVLISDKVDLK